MVLVGIAGWHAHSSQILPPPVASKIGEGFPIVWPFSESTSVMGHLGRECILDITVAPVILSCFAV